MTAICNTNDGTQAEPYLRPDLNLGNLTDLPDWSAGPTGDSRDRLETIKAAGYRGVQGGDPDACRALGLGCTTGGRVNKPGEIAASAARARKAGFEAMTLHVGWGHESDAEIDALVRDILAVSANEGLPLYIETHRATITQDTWRTVQLVERHPDVRFNADFSHWYSGLEMPYGSWEEKLAFLAPVFERVRFLHLRCGNSSHIQVALDHPSMVKALEHFHDLWTRSFAGFLRSAAPGDFISVNPELLPPAINYAQTFREPTGGWRESSDRWEDAHQLVLRARAAFAAAAAGR